MGVETEAGYTWTDGKKARLLHAGNRLPIKSVTASDDSGSTADLANNDLTVDRWTPFANDIPSPLDLGEEWTASGLAIGADGQTLTEDGSTGLHRIFDAYTLSAVESVLAFKVQRETMPEVQLLLQDSGATVRTCFFDLRDGTVGTASNCTGDITDLGGGKFLLKIRFTPPAGSGTVNLRGSNGSENTSYTGSSSNTIKVLGVYANDSEATLRMDTFTAQTGTCFAVAAHNLWSSGGRIAFEHDSNEDNTWTNIGTVTPTTDGPIMFFFDAVSSSRWRITIDRAAVPEVGIVHVGDPLVFQRTFYSGFTPARMNRATDVIGNVSRSGELLGRSVKRTILSQRASWENLTYAWVRANLDGPSGAIQALETKGAFMAWRPELATDDVDYLMRASVTPPQAQGVKDLWAFSMDTEVYAYE